MTNLPAFPVTPEAWSAGSTGMTLRDYLAAQVMVGFGTWTPAPYALGGLDQDKAIKARAMLAYAQADAMLEARKDR